VFTLGDDGKTTVQKFEPYDDTYDKIFLNVAIGTGVILVCVVLTVVTDGAGAPAAAAIFATSAKTGAIAAVSSALIGGTASGVITGIETEDFDESMKAAALAGSDGYKWGAITGALTGGASELIALNGATSGGLTMNQVAQIQKESKYPLDLIKQFKSMEEFNVFFNEAKLSTGMINGRTALLPKDTLNSKSFLNFKSKQPDGTEITNLQRMLNGNAPIDPATNKVLQLHHIGQKASSQAVLSARAKAGLSQKELSELTGIDQSDISKIERGVANPSVATLERIAAALGGRLTIAIEPA
jgi:DNA-binding XRE family transcriptional regulator